MPADCLGDLAQHRQQVAARLEFWHERRIGSEGEAGSTLGRGYPEWNEPLGSSDGQTLGGQPGLAHPCWPGQNCSSPAGPEEPGDLLELSRSAHERPRQAHGSPTTQAARAQCSEQGKRSAKVILFSRCAVVPTPTPLAVLVKLSRCRYLTDLGSPAEIKGEDHARGPSL